MTFQTPADERDRWFYIIGCQRSGTTLMRLILESHSHIDVCDESTSYHVVGGRVAPERRRRLLGLKVPCLTEQFARPTLWDEFLLRQAVPNDYRGQKLVFMIRDVRDTVASLYHLRLNHEPWQGGRWFDMALVPYLKAKIAHDAAFRRRYATEIRMVRTAANGDVAKAAFYWRYKCDALLDYLALGYPVLVVRYEDLVAQPQIELLRICGFLQVPWEPALLAHHTAAHADVHADGATTGGTDPNRPIDGRSVERWRSAFTPGELEDILRFAGGLQPMLYPETPIAAAAAPAASAI